MSAPLKGADVEMLVAYRLTVLHPTEDVKNAFSLLSNAKSRRPCLLWAWIRSRTRAASLAAYEIGMISLIEVLQADDALLRTSDARAQAQTEAARAAVTAFKGFGGGYLPGESRVLAVK